MPSKDIMQAGDHWVTLEDGQHVLIGSGGEIRAGLGPNHVGKTFAQAFGSEQSNGLSSAYSMDGRDSQKSANVGAWNATVTPPQNAADRIFASLLATAQGDNNKRAAIEKVMNTFNGNLAEQPAAAEKFFAQPQEAIEKDINIAIKNQLARDFNASQNAELAAKREARTTTAGLESQSIGELLIKKGGSRWQKGDNDRTYLQNVARDEYDVGWKKGRIDSIDGNSVGTSGLRIHDNALRSIYYDNKSNEFVTTATEEREKAYAQDAIERIKKRMGLSSF